MIPERRGGLGVLIAVVGGTGDGIGIVGLGEDIAALSIARRNPLGAGSPREPPCLRVAVAVRLDVGAVDMGYERHRTGIGVGYHGLAVGAVRGAHGTVRLGRICPVQGLIDREEMRQIIAADRVNQIVDPAH